MEFKGKNTFGGVAMSMLMTNAQMTNSQKICTIDYYDEFWM